MSSTILVALYDEVLQNLITDLLEGLDYVVVQCKCNKHSITAALAANPQIDLVIVGYGFGQQTLDLTGIINADKDEQPLFIVFDMPRDTEIPALMAMGVTTVVNPIDHNTSEALGELVLAHLRISGKALVQPKTAQMRAEG